MGRRNQQRRASKARARAARQRQRTEGRQQVRADESGPPPTERIIAALLLAADAYLGGDEAAAGQCAADLATTYHSRLDVLDAALRAVEGLVAAMWRGGWLPEDLHQIARRRRDRDAVAYLVDVIAAEARCYPAARMHHRWHDQLRQIGATRWWSSKRPHLAQWAQRRDAEPADAVRAAIEVLALLRSLPALPRILPLPGTARSAPATGQRGVDQKVLARVRALLAKAESTGFPDEAEALSAKAQELMARHALERAVVEADHGEPERASARRLWLDNPYLGAKALLVDAVAAANRCRAVSSEKLGFVTVLGDEVDLEIVELLATSLLVQATKAMLAAGARINRRGHSRTRSYRHSFLVAYATRIRERLRGASDEAVSAASAAADASLLPVLTARQQAVDGLFDDLFPALVHRSVSVSNAEGWWAGRAAADLAVLDTRRSVAAAG